MKKQSLIERYTSEAALRMEMELSDISLVNGIMLGCTDIDLVNISAHGREVGAVVFHSDLELLSQGVVCDRLEFAIRLALVRLQKMSLDGAAIQ